MKNLPEEIKLIEIEKDLDILTKRFEDFEEDYKIIKQETKRSRLFWHLLDFLPGGAKIVLVFLMVIISITSLTAELLIRITNLDIRIQRYLYNSIFEERIKDNIKRSKDLDS